MAKTSAALLNLALVLLLLLFISMAEANVFTRKFSFPKASSTPRTPICESVYGAQSGDTCIIVQNKFGLTAEEFSAINPNLVCETLFAGQWLCVVGSA